MMKYKKQTFLVLVLFLSTLFSSPLSYAQQSLLESLVEQGEIRVGTTGDYKPFSYWNIETESYEGLDIDAAQMLARELGINVRFVATSWQTLADGILENRYDIAMSGITRTLARQKIVGMSDPYIDVGKVLLIRDEDRDRFKSLDDINQADIRLGVNPGGTNELFVQENITRANVVMIESNLEIPERIANGDVDAMITDNIEATLYANMLPELHIVNPDQPFTRNNVGYMTHRDDQAFLNWLNLWLDQMQRDGSYDNLKLQWIGQTAEGE
ncbi:MAG: transporter substrate-binding domain-containing protein [Gammaproteobacteria bacterium]|jgi:cyclohexadienyl dehydratase|nr:transporter substrate-binding domain-containing protein [Gammaproteobacteria bacterium]